MVVGIEWVFECLEKWKHVDEEKFILDVPNPLRPKPGEAEEVQESGEERELDPNIADGFMRSIQRGDVDWNDIDEELKELYDSEEDGDESNKENEDGNKENDYQGDNAKNQTEEESKKRKREFDSDSDDLGLGEDWD